MSKDCVENTNGSLITVRENGRRAIFVNSDNKKFEKIHVDGCLITDGIRCDWMVRKIGVGTVLVELKGSDLEHACKQLFKTLEHDHSRPHLENRTALLIVSSRSPSFDTRVAKAKEHARKRGTSLIVRTREARYTIEQLV